MTFTARIDPQTKDALRRRLTELLAAHGRALDYGKVRAAEFPDITKASFYLVLRQVEASGRPAMKAKARIERAVKKHGQKAVVVSGVNQIAECLPAPVGPGDMIGLNLSQIVEKLRECMDSADKIKTHATGQDGQVRNAKLYLQASEHLRRTLETAADMASRVWDVRQVERLHAILFHEIRQESPELVHRILARLQSSQELGVMIQAGGAATG